MLLNKRGYFRITGGKIIVFSLPCIRRSLCSLFIQDFIDQVIPDGSKGYFGYVFFLTLLCIRKVFLRLSMLRLFSFRLFRFRLSCGGIHSCSLFGSTA
jgi:hypothetical protein